MGRERFGANAVDITFSYLYFIHDQVDPMKVLNKDKFQKLPDAILIDIDNTLYPYEPAHLAAYRSVREKINKQVDRTRTEESSPKNTTLYFSLLVETKDLLKANSYLLNEYNDSFDAKVKPATISK